MAHLTVYCGSERRNDPAGMAATDHHHPDETIARGARAYSVTVDPHHRNKPAGMAATDHHPDKTTPAAPRPSRPPWIRTPQRSRRDGSHRPPPRRDHTRGT
jgi:hypothetical protein